MVVLIECTRYQRSRAKNQAAAISAEQIQTKLADDVTARPHKSLPTRPFPECVGALPNLEQARLAAGDLRARYPPSILLTTLAV
jgi:hypothetical protein